MNRLRVQDSGRDVDNNLCGIQKILPPTREKNELMFSYPGKDPVQSNQSGVLTVGYYHWTLLLFTGDIRIHV